jgi:hypothetical protein
MDDLISESFWSQPYVRAVLESNPQLVKQRALEAQWAVTARLEELGRSIESDDEKDSLLRASFALERLRDNGWEI